MWIIHTGHPAFWLITVLDSVVFFFFLFGFPGFLPRQGILKVPALDHDSPVAQESQRCCVHVVEGADPRAHVSNLLPSWNFHAALSLIKLSAGFPVMSVQLSFFKSFGKCSNAEASAAAFLFYPLVSLARLL